MAASLVLKRNGAETDIVFEVHPPAIIGRFDPEVGPIDVDLGSLSPEGGYVSRRHAKIELEDGAYVVQDLGSSNGTFVLDGEFVRVDRQALADGDEVAFGNARFIFRLPGEAEEPVEAAADEIPVAPEVADSSAD